MFVGVGFGTVMIGALSAWLVTMYDFPGRKHFSWLLLLPLAMPTYLLAYTYTDLLEYAGPIQSTLREIMGWTSAKDYYFPKIRSIPGAIVFMSLVLYPYVYITTRSGLLELSPGMLESSKVLNRSGFYTLFKIILPLTRPSIIIGLTLVLLEVLNDFGTVDYFAIKTISAGIFDVWLNMGNLGGAAQIALMALIFVLFLIYIERLGRKKQRFYQSQRRFEKIQHQPLSGLTAFIATFLCALPIVLGFVIPVLVLLYYSVIYFEQSWTPQFRNHAFNSLSLAFMASLATISIALLMTYSQWISKNRVNRVSNQLAITAYALPGLVLAIGLLVPLSKVDHFLNEYVDDSIGLFLSGTVITLLIAYIIRFIAVALGSLESSFNRITPAMDMTARSLGYSRGQILFKFYLPLVKTGLFSAALLVFVDTMKELPATLILRPFNYDTLATHVFQYASDEQLHLSALSALLIVISGILPILILNRTLSKSRALD